MEDMPDACDLVDGQSVVTTSRRAQAWRQYVLDQGQEARMHSASLDPSKTETKAVSVRPPPVVIVFQ